MNPQQPQNQDPNAQGHHWEPGQNPFFTEPTPNSTNVPVQQPEVYNSPTLANVPYGAQPAPQPIMPNGGTPTSGSTNGPNKFVLIGAALAALLVVSIIIVVVVISSSGNKKQTTEQTTDTTKSQSLQPATSLDLGQTSNAINQDMSTLDDEKDFPATSLDDKSLSL